MKTTEKQTTTFPKLQLIDIGSPFFVGIGYAPSPEEKRELGVDDDDDRPMSILGLSKDEIAGIDCHGNGRKLAELFCAAPELLEALKQAASILHDIAREDLNDVEEVTSNTADKFDALIAKATGGAR